MSELRTLEYVHDGVMLKGQLATPAGPGPHPAVLVMNNAHGLGEQVRDRARALAEAGYVALATDMYGDGVYFSNPADAGGPFSALQDDPQRLRARVLAGYEALRAVSGVDVGRIGAVGFCFGGQCVLELARSGAEVKAVASFHGLLTTRLPARPGEVKAKVLILTGAQDPYAPAEHVEEVRQELTAAGADWQITVYGEGWHSFTDPNADLKQVPGVRYDPLLEKLSWAQASAFLDAVVRG